MPASPAKSRTNQDRPGAGQTHARRAVAECCNLRRRSHARHRTPDGSTDGPWCPTSCRAASRGNWVSVSSVMTYLMAGKMDVSPTISEKHVAGTAAEEGVELHELSTLALVSHPQAFSRIPAARSVKQEKEVWHSRKDTSGSASRLRPAPAGATLDLQAESPPARRGNPSAERSKGADPDSRDDESPMSR